MPAPPHHRQDQRPRGAALHIGPSDLRRPRADRVDIPLRDPGAGDLIYTGTSGQPAELHAGDTVEVEIEGIGVLSNPVGSD